MGTFGPHIRRQTDGFTDERAAIMFFSKFIMVLVVSLILAASTSARVVRQRRRFPGERRLGPTNYGQYFFGARGYEPRVHLG